MSTGAIAKRYARALLAYATERGEEEVLYRQTECFVRAYMAMPQLREVLLSPVTSGEERVKLVRQAVGGILTKSLEDFLHLVTRHRRYPYLYFMLHSYRILYKEERGMHEAHLETAYRLSEPQRQRLHEVLQHLCGGTLELQEEENPALLGGFRLRMDDLMIDATLRSRLERIKRYYSDNSNRIV